MFENTSPHLDSYGMGGVKDELQIFLTINQWWVLCPMFYFHFYCCNKTLTTSNLEEKGPYLGDDSTQQSITEGKWRQTLETSHTTSAIEKETKACILACLLASSQLAFSSLILFRTPWLGNGTAHKGLTSINNQVNTQRYWPQANWI